jgi:uncharacterized protein (UPF0276 family)
MNVPNLGFGLGLRSQHFPYLLQHDDVTVDWFEIISENYMNNYGYARHALLQIAEKVPLVMHGVSLNIGSTDPLNYDYLAKLKSLASLIRPQWVSDHLCWTGIATHNSHDLLPLPLTEESLQHVIQRVLQVQDYLQRPLILENPSTYLEFQQSTLNEAAFFTELVKATQCGILLDVNNVYVSAHNHGYDPYEYIRSLPATAIVQIHLAGHTATGDLLIDTHDQPVPEEVWKLYQLAQQLTGGVATLLEWDANIPEYPVLVQELFKAKEVINGVLPTRVLPAHNTQIVSTPINHQLQFNESTLS